MRVRGPCNRQWAPQNDPVRGLMTAQTDRGNRKGNSAHCLLNVSNEINNLGRQFGFHQRVKRGQEGPILLLRMLLSTQEQIDAGHSAHAALPLWAARLVLRPQVRPARHLGRVPARQARSRAQPGHVRRAGGAQSQPPCPRRSRARVRRQAAAARASRQEAAPIGPSPGELSISPEIVAVLEGMLVRHILEGGEAQRRQT